MSSLVDGRQDQASSIEFRLKLACCQQISAGAAAVADAASGLLIPLARLLRLVSHYHFVVRFSIRLVGCLVPLALVLVLILVSFLVSVNSPAGLVYSVPIFEK